MEVQTEKERVLQLLKGWQFDRSRHGSLFDRGGADSYYGRSPRPHYGGVGGDSGERVAVQDKDSVDEYMAGYAENEAGGFKKEY